MRSAWNAFWGWYERSYALNAGIALGLFSLQVFHLLWLSGEVAWAHLFGAPLFSFSGFWQQVIVLVDYTEIPALISVSLLYVNELRSGWKWKSILYLLLLNSQWLHIAWITDEFVISVFFGEGASFPAWLAWVAIGIDYLELPVMYDTGRKLAAALAERRLAEFAARELRER